jgi:hypothetical protein
MPYTVTWPQRGAYKKFSGKVSMDELLESLSIVQCHPDFDTLRFSITDFLDVEGFEFKERDILLYGANVIGGQMNNPRLVIGIVATHPDILALLKTRYEPIVRYPVGYYPTREACAQWVEEMTGIAVIF